MSPFLKWAIGATVVIVAVALLSGVVRDRIAATAAANRAALAEETRQRRIAEAAAKGPGGLLGTGILGREGIFGLEGVAFL